MGVTRKTLTEEVDSDHQNDIWAVGRPYEPDNDLFVTCRIAYALRLCMGSIYIYRTGSGYIWIGQCKGCRP
jgi:hypothetical protein